MSTPVGLNRIPSEDFDRNSPFNSSFSSRSGRTYDVLDGKRVEQQAAGAPPKTNHAIAKILNIAAKIAVIVAAVFAVTKICISTVCATIAYPLSLAITLPGILFWYVIFSQKRESIVKSVNEKINSL